MLLCIGEFVGYRRFGRGRGIYHRLHVRVLALRAPRLLASWRLRSTLAMAYGRSRCTDVVIRAARHQGRRRHALHCQGKYQQPQQQPSAKQVHTATLSRRD